MKRIRKKHVFSSKDLKINMLKGKQPEAFAHYIASCKPYTTPYGYICSLEDVEFVNQDYFYLFARMYVTMHKVGTEKS